MSIRITNVASSKVWNAAGKLWSDGRRKETGKDSRRLFGLTAPAGQTILLDQRERRLRQNLSHESVGRDRTHARQAFLSQPGQAEIPDANELLRTSSGA